MAQAARVNRSVALVVDVANVMGSRPDGWWRDRAAAATRVVTALSGVSGHDVDGPDGVPMTLQRVVAVVEGQALNIPGEPGVDMVRATRDGDTAIVASCAELVSVGSQVLVVTADRGLRERLPGPVSVIGPRWLLSVTG
jgi:hypothetical protein